MLSYCLKCRKDAESKSPKVVRNKSGRIIFLSNFVVRNSKKSKIIKEQEASGLLGSLGIWISLNKNPSLAPLLF